MRIAVVNDVPLVAEALQRFVRDHTPHELAWTAVDGQDAIEKTQADVPDLILMDLVMPRMDGVEATRQIMRISPTAILIVTASVDKLTSKVFEALGAGALDAVNTPVLSSLQHAQDDPLHKKISTIARLVGKRPAAGRRGTPRAETSRTPLVALGASSGGPGALSTILAQLPSDFPGCLTIVQHIDSAFIKGLVEWLAGQTRLAVKEAVEGAVPAPGTVWVAATEHHMVMRRDQTLGYTQKPLDSIHRPSIDVFFQSVAEHWQGACTGVILTGMGADGAAGLLALRQRGFTTLAQDRDSSSIYGMPKAAAERGAAQRIVPLNKIAQELLVEIAR